ncbi:MAG: DUF4400 domain-containing protein [Betaproteobacteria bacterium]|jgi:hypothetical protein|nr:DUF4400 domain-containing protein [Betaproteobacteria bacterium]
MVGGHIKLWLGLTGIIFFVTPLLKPADTIIRQVTQEVSYVHQHLGVEQGDRFIKAANEFFDESIVRSGIAAIAIKSEAPSGLADQQFAKPATRAGDLARGYATGLLANLYALILRVSLAAAWLPLLVPFIGACVWDAIQMRRRKDYTLDYVNPGTYGAGLHAIVFLCFIPLVYFVAPMPVSPLLVPLLFVPAGLVMNWTIQNMQRVSV